jgi:membrane-bound serine protease (ClpP class)
MEFMLNPNVAYLVLLVGILLGFLALVTPGTGLLELGALFCLVLAGYAVYNLSIHWWALAILLLSLPPFVMAIRRPRQTYLLALAILLLILGSVFLFANGEGLISVHPLIAVVSSGVMALALWVVLRKSIEAGLRRPAHDLDALVGQVGEAKSSIQEDGNAYVSGELWSARSEARIESGSRIRVIRREGFVLVVEEVE